MSATTRLTGTIAPAVLELLAADRSLSSFGISTLHAHQGRATLSVTVTEEFSNGHALAHGGLIFALADTALAFAASSLTPGAVTAESSIIYLTPARVGEELVAEAEVRSTSGRHSVVDVTVRAGDRVVAEFRGRGTTRKGK